MRSEISITFIVTPRTVTPDLIRGLVKQYPSCGGLFLLDTGSVTPDSIRGRYDGDELQRSAFNPKLIDVLERVSSRGQPFYTGHRVGDCSIIRSLLFRRRLDAPRADQVPFGWALPTVQFAASARLRSVTSWPAT